MSKCDIGRSFDIVSITSPASETLAKNNRYIPPYIRFLRNATYFRGNKNLSLVRNIYDQNKKNSKFSSIFQLNVLFVCFLRACTCIYQLRKWSLIRRRSSSRRRARSRLENCRFRFFFFFPRWRSLKSRIRFKAKSDVRTYIATYIYIYRNRRFDCDRFCVPPSVFNSLAWAENCVCRARR